MKIQLKISPALKTIIFALSVILSGILCSGFIAEITVKGKLIWGNFYKTYTFYFIIIYIIILYFYNRFIYEQEKRIINFLDDDYCKAYLRSQFLPEIVAKYREDIRNGKKSSDLKEYHKELEKILK